MNLYRFNLVVILWVCSHARQLRLLPVAGLFPDLSAEVVEILGRWYQRFNLKTWSRIVKVCKGSAHQVPCVLKELNESAPVIQKVRSWVDSLPTTAPKACIVDLGAGFGFLSMLLAELLPPERVAKFFLLDMTYPNLGVGNSSGSTSIEHLKGGWKIPMYTLKVDLKKKTTLNQLAARVFRAPVSEEDTRWAPVYACGIHLCNTLGIRAAQLFNENVDVRGFAFVPCCFPTSRHLTQDVIYQLGEHQFAARDFLDAKKMPSNNARFSRWAEHILEGIDPGPTGFKGLERHRLVRPRRGMFAQDVYIFAERPLEALPHAPWQRREEEGRGKAVVIWAKYGHGKARKRVVREVREEREAEKVRRLCWWESGSLELRYYSLPLALNVSFIFRQHQGYCSMMQGSELALAKGYLISTHFKASDSKQWKTMETTPRREGKGREGKEAKEWKSTAGNVHLFLTGLPRHGSAQRRQARAEPTSRPPAPFVSGRLRPRGHEETKAHTLAQPRIHVVAYIAAQSSAALQSARTWRSLLPARWAPALLLVSSRRPLKCKE